MSDTQRTRRLVLSARIESKSPSHATIGVFQNGGKAGELCVDVQFAEEVVSLIDRTKDVPSVDILDLLDQAAKVEDTV